MDNLQKSAFGGPRGPVVLVIMDGVGIGRYREGDAVRSALTPTLDWLRDHYPHMRLKAHGVAVGLPSDEDMGNSEVGHNAIGCGRVVEQGARLVNAAIADGTMFHGGTWQRLAENCRRNGSTFHFIGLFSDGNVHSHIDHLKAMIVQAKAEHIKRVRIHVLLDGRDVGETSALDYLVPFEGFIAGLRDSLFDCRIASGGGRMFITMDRYNANWDMVRRGWDTHVRGAGREFHDARTAIETLRREKPGVIDQDLPSFVVAESGRPIGPIADGDSVVYFNFRGDRAIEISRAFEEDAFTVFDRAPRPRVEYAGMMQYDGDLKIPRQFLVNPPAIDRTMGEYLVRAGIAQLAISETQKFGHVTYFFNGNRSGKFDAQFEEYVEVPSDILPYEQRPWMKAAEITDRVLDAVTAGKHRFIRLNYPNGDMVGHTGVYQAAEIAVEVVDLCLGRLVEAVRAAEGILLISADHGNADDMYEHDKATGAVKVDLATGRIKVKTSHSLNPVPAYLYEPTGRIPITINRRRGLGISSLAATCLTLLGFVPPRDYAPSICEIGC